MSENRAHQSYTACTQLVESAERGTLALDWIGQAIQSEADEWARRGAAPDPSVIAMRDAVYSARAAIHLALASGRDIARSIARSAAASGNGELAVKAVALARDAAETAVEQATELATWHGDPTELLADFPDQGALQLDPDA